jgi:hypothetical protein
LHRGAAGEGWGGGGARRLGLPRVPSSRSDGGDVGLDAHPPWDHTWSFRTPRRRSWKDGYSANRSAEVFPPFSAAK